MARNLYVKDGKRKHIQSKATELDLVRKDGTPLPIPELSELELRYHPVNKVDVNWNLSYAWKKSAETFINTREFTGQGAWDRIIRCAAKVFVNIEYGYTKYKYTRDKEEIAKHNQIFSAILLKWAKTTSPHSQPWIQKLAEIADLYTVAQITMS